MSLTYTIIPESGLVYVRYVGTARLAETMEVFGRYAQDPAYRPGQKQLVDLSGITGYERDFLEMVKLQARKAETMSTNGAQSLAVYHAPTSVSLEMARLVGRSWEGLEKVVVRVAQSEDQALEMLGVPGARFADLPMKDA